MKSMVCMRLAGAATVAAACAVMMFSACKEEGTGTIVEPLNIGDGDVVAESKFDTLCAYRWKWVTSFSEGTQRIQSADQLTVLLESTGYNEDSDDYWIFKRMAHEPDFTKWTYFAYAGPKWWWGVEMSEETDTITVTFINNPPPDCVYEEPPCMLAPPARVVFVFFIPFTEREIVFKNITRAQ